MKRSLYSVWDRKAKAYGPVMAYQHEAQAVRDFGQACADPQSMLSKYPDDFELHRIADVADEEEFQPVVGCRPECVVTAQAVIAIGSSGPRMEREA